MNKRIAICIPSYKNRYSNLLSNLVNIDKKYDIYVFLSENDFETSGYDKYDWTPSNIEYVVTPCKSIFEKRQYMLDFVREHNYDGYFQLDDDIMFTRCGKISEKTKRTTSNSYRAEICDFNELLDVLVKKAEEYDAGFSSPVFPYIIGFSKPNTVNVNKALTYGQFFYLDIHKMNEFNINFDTSGTIHEDMDVVLQLIQNGVNCITVGDYCLALNSTAIYASSKASTTLNRYDAGILKVGLYLKYRDGITLRVNNKNGTLIAMTKPAKYFGTKEIPIKNDKYHQGLYEICKTRDLAKVIEYIQSNKNKG